MTLVDDDAGQFNVSLDTTMNEVRKPVFVDNALHHALLSSQTSSKNKVTIENRNNATYTVASSNRYTLAEGNSTVQMTHTSRPGHNYEGAPFFSGERISTTTKPSMLLYNSTQPKQQRLKGSSFVTSDKGITLNLPNMQGLSLNDIGYTGGDVHLGQSIDVGLRTTDLAIQLGRGLTGTLTSVNLSLPRKVTSTNTDRRKHSLKFFAQDFNQIPILQAMKFISRQDGRVTYFDRFGNLLFVPFNLSEAGRALDENIRLGGQHTNPVDNMENRVTVQGSPLALNLKAEVTVDDRARQQGSFDFDIQQANQPVFDTSIKTEAAARRLARMILRANNISSGAITTEGHPNSWDLRPGVMVVFKGKRHVIMEAVHRFSEKESDFVFLSLDTGIEGVLQGIANGGISAAYTQAYDESEQVTREEISLFDGLEIVITPITVTRTVSPSGFIIGKNMTRSTIGLGNESIGTKKSYSLIMRSDDV